PGNTYEPGSRCVMLIMQKNGQVPSKQWRDTMYLIEATETRYLVIAYLPTDSRRFRLSGPVLVETRDYIHFYLTGTKLPVDTIAYVVVRDYPVGITEEQATDFFVHSFNELVRRADALEEEVSRPIPARRQYARAA